MVRFAGCPGVRVLVLGTLKLLLGSFWCAPGAVWVLLGAYLLLGGARFLLSLLGLVFGLKGRFRASLIRNLPFFPSSLL